MHVSRKAGGKLSESSSPGDEDDSDAIVGGLFGAAACVLVVVAVLVVFLWRNEQRQPNKSADELFIDGEQGVDSSRQGLALLSIGTNITLKPASLSALYANSTQEASAGSEHYANFDQSFVPTVDPVPVGNFRNYMSYMQNVGGYAKEFRALPKEILGPQEAANDPLVDSSKKNRFKDICPYDNNRVVLMKMKDTDSDFINASYIGGFAESMAYIAAQGPMPSTVDDFWHMIWVEGCGKIVMLTSLFEQGKVKCERYWPSEEKRTQTYGQYVVTLQKTMTRAFFKQHTLKVTKSVLQNEDGDASRQINHFHFTAWPDHGVPSAPAFVEFWEFVQHIPSRLPGPLLVHCSAGVGRTGTYIALDILAHQADIMGKVSIFPTVRRLRRERVKMVQALSQYIFLHEGVAEVLESRDFYVFLYDLRDNSDWSPSPGTWHLADAVRPKFVSQFQKLASLRPVLSKTDTETALLPENVSKNRFAHILPDENHRACLWSPDGETSDYINAVFLPSIAQQLGFVVTQLQMENTKADFWRLVSDWRVKVVVRLLTPQQQKSESYLYPAVDTWAKFGAVTVTTEAKLPWKQGIKMFTIQLQRKDAGAQRQTVTVYSVDVDETAPFTDTATFVSLADMLMPIVGTLPQPPVVIQCLDGASLSCLLCGLVTALQVLQTVGKVSPYLLARLIQKTRPQAFSTLEQYEFMVRCLLDHARDSQYTNMDDTKPDAGIDNIYGNV